MHARYAVGGVAGAVHGGLAAQGQASGVVTVVGRGRERVALVSLQDDRGRLAAAEAWEDTDADGKDDTEIGLVCGRARLRASRPAATLRLYPVVGLCGTAVAVTTTGTVSVTLSAR